MFEVYGVEIFKKLVKIRVLGRKKIKNDRNSNFFKIENMVEIVKAARQAARRPRSDLKDEL